MSIEKTKIIPVTYSEKENKKTPIRLTVRGKVAAAALAGVTVFGVGYAASEANSVDFSRDTHTETAVPGDKLWDMAGSVENVNGYKREAIDKAKELSPDLQDGSLDVGDEVIFPDKRLD